MPKKSTQSGSKARNSDQYTIPDHGLNEKRLQDLRDLLSPPKVRILQQMLASPGGALSAVELSARNDITESTIRDHLRDLQDRDRALVTVLDANISPVPNGFPRKYYAVSRYGIELLKQLDLYDQIGILYDMYEAASLELPCGETRSVNIKDIEDFDHRPHADWL